MLTHSLFRDMSESEIDEAMMNISAGEFIYNKGAVILQAGDVTQSMGLVLEGSTSVESTDLWGNNTLLGIMKPGEIFAVTYALLGEPLLVDVLANENCRVLFLRVYSLPMSCSWAAKLSHNLLAITARKNLHLSERTFINANRSIRRRVMNYLNSESLRAHSREFAIPFNRQQMADYLGSDRSALSKELCSMRDEGIIEFHKNKFILKRGIYPEHKD